MELDLEPESDLPSGCAVGRVCNPWVIHEFPFEHHADTTEAIDDLIDTYMCAPQTDESGPEFYYRIDLEEPGWLNILVDDGDRIDVDIDIHLLDENRTCLQRDDREIEIQLEPGSYSLVLDTYVSSSQGEEPGPYQLTVQFFGARGDCSIEERELRMRWGSCELDACFERGHDRYLSLPSSGPVVKEAHLVTQSDDFNRDEWPFGPRDELDAHYELSDYEMQRREDWAPAGEGGSRWGESSAGRPPVLDETWYITMNWRDRPERGARMLVLNPQNDRAVIAAAGWETGPGSASSVAGVSEEIHHYLGTSHLDTLLIGFTSDQQLDFGPITCD